MPDAKRDGRPANARTAASREADHAEIGRLAEVLVPALIAKLSSTRLGELEVRQGDWRVRLRRPATADGPNLGRRVTDRASRSQPGHEGHGHPRGAPEGVVRTRLAGVGPGDGGSSNGTGGGGRGDHHGRNPHFACSPAVGVFHPGSRATVGTRVRDGESLGTVDVLGVPQEVVSPGEGVVATTLVEGGTAVEYGQELVRIELTATVEAR